MKKSFFIATCLIATTAFTVLNAQSKYKIADKIHLDGDAGWDYCAVDEAANRLYVSHGTMVQVVDLSTNKIVGTIADTKGVHGIAIANDLNKGFISDGKDSAVTIFDLSTLATITKVTITGQNPDAITYEPVTHRVFTFNGHSSNSTVIDAKTNAVIGTIALPGKPEFAVADGMGKLFFNLEEKNMICSIDASTMKVGDSWNLAPGDGPSGLAMDTKTRRLFSVCDNKLMVVVNADNGKVVTTVATGDRTDAAGFDSGMNIVYSSNGDGTLTAIKEENADKYTIIENVATQKGARTCAVNSKTHHIYLPCAEYGDTPAPTKDKPHPKPSIKPGSFMILDIAPIQ